MSSINQMVKHFCTFLKVLRRSYISYIFNEIKGHSCFVCFITNKFILQLIFDDLNKDFESFTEKISELAQEKQEAEKR